MTHFVLTRFAIRAPFRSQGPYEALSEKWIARRFDLFKMYSLPSMQAQTRPDFRWLVFVHPGFSLEWARCLRELDGRIEVIEANDCSKHPLYQTHDDVVLTTRLDSDDGLGHDALERLQSMITGEPVSSVSLTSGYKIDAATGVVYNNGISNLFLTMIERRAPRIGVLSEDHSQYTQKYDVTFDAAPGQHWMTAHDCNVVMGFIQQGATVANLADVHYHFPLVRV